MPDDLLDQADQNAMDGLFAGIMPDEEGRVLDNARRLGTDPRAVKAASAPQLTGLLEAESRRRILGRDTRLAKWMADHPLYAALSHDDAPQLEDLGKRLGLMAQTYRDMPTTGEKWKALALAPLQGLASGVGGLSQAIYGGASFLSEAATGDSSVSRYLRERAQIGAELPSAFRWNYGGQTVEEARASTERLSELNALQTTVLGRRFGTEEISGGAVSLAPTLAAGFASGGSYFAVLAAAALQSAGGAYADLREQGEGVGGSGAKALLAAAITAGVMRVVPNADKVLVSMLSRSAAPKVAARAMLGSALGTAGGEFTEEGLDQFLNSLLVMGKPVAEAAKDAVQAGLIGGVIGGAVGAGNARQLKQMAQVEAAGRTYQSERDMLSALDASKTAERSKEVVQSYMQTVNPELAKEQAYFDPEVVKAVLAKPEAEKALAAIGVTKGQVDAAARAGSTVAVSRLRFLTELPAEVRDALHEHARTAPDAVSKAEADEVKDAQSDQDEAAAKQAVKALKSEEKRLLKEFMEAGGVDEATARTSLKPLLTGAKALFSRNPAGAKAPIDLLKKVSFKKGDAGSAIKTAQQKLADLGGKTGNARVSLTDQLPPGVAARLDPLTRQLAADPAQVGEALMARVAAVPEVQLAGKAVKVTDETGAVAEVDAATAVGMLRKKLEDARRLKLCLEGA